MIAQIKYRFLQVIVNAAWSVMAWAVSRQVAAKRGPLHGVVVMKEGEQ